MSTVELCRPEQLPFFQWPAGTAYERAFLTPLVGNRVHEYVANVHTTLLLLRVGSLVVPVTINDAESDNSYVCSPYTATVSYPLEELHKLESRSLRWSLALLIRTLAPLLWSARINKVVTVNNWLLSTNLYPDWEGAGLETATELLCQHAPDHAILFRSLNEGTYAPLCRRFLEAGYLLVPSRQVYLFDGVRADCMKRINTRRDQKLLRTTPYAVVSHAELTANDDAEIVRLYQLLYLQKYSHHNPQFTERLIRLWREERLLEMTGLRNAAGRLDGIVGCFARGQVTTAPLVGYDTALPQEVGLYRMLMALVLRASTQQAITLNLSSGAADFKRVRGGVPCVEYTAVYCRHLPRYRRAVWHTLALLLRRIGIPVLSRYKL